MTIKMYSRILTSLLWIILGLIGAFLIGQGKHIYYTYAPVENFIVFERLDFQDYKKGSKVQSLISYRDSKVTTVGDFTYKVYCNRVGNPSWSFRTPGIILDRTDGLKAINIEMPVEIRLPKGNCRIEAIIDIYIKGYVKFIHLSDNFKVY